MKLDIVEKFGRLRNALHSAAMQLEEASCTCVDRSNGHQRPCVGVDLARDYHKLVERSRHWKS